MRENGDAAGEMVGLFGGNARYYDEAVRAVVPPTAPVVTLTSERHLADYRDRLTILLSPAYPSTVGRPERLRLLHATGAGLDRIDRSLLPAGCTVCSTPGHEIPMAEFIVYSMLRLALQGRMLEESFARGSRQGGAHGEDTLHGELYGQTVCLVGYGLVGREARARAAAMGMRIGVVTRSAVTEPGIEWWLPPERMAEAAAKADFVVVVCPLTAETRGLIDAAVLAAMRPGAFLVNVARAEIVDEAALHGALVAKAIAGAALDVWYQPPPTGDGLWQASQCDFRSLENVLATPHASAWTEALWQRRVGFVVDNLRRYFSRRPVRGVASP